MKRSERVYWLFVAVLWITYMALWFGGIRAVAYGLDFGVAIVMIITLYGLRFFKKQK